MDLIQLVKRLRQEAGASGNDGTVVGATGEWKRLVDWTIDAWLDIQEDEPEWDFMQKDISFPTIAGQSTYAPPVDFRRWMNHNFRLQQTGPGDEIFMNQLPYDSFRNIFEFGSYRDQEAVPYTISIHPSKSLILGPKPLGVHTVLGRYYKLPVALVNDADEPDFPERYHMIVVWRALLSYGGYEMAQDSMARAKNEYQKIMDRLKFDQLQPIEVHRRFI